MQISIAHKTKQFFSLVIKLAIVIGAAYFIYDTLANNSNLDFKAFVTQLETSGVFKITTISILLVATFLNWLLEIIKWKTLVQHIKSISLWESTAHSLGGLTASLFTPNRIGEYGAKALFFPKLERKHVVGLNFLGNLAQLITTLFFGLIGFSLFTYEFGVELPWYKILRMFAIIAFVGGIFLIVNSQKRFEIKGYSWNSLKGFLTKISPEIHLKNITIAVFRYVIFAHQFYFLLLLFGLNTSYVTAISAITSMYLITSLIPMLFIFDVIVKGSVAVWLFGYLNVPELSILTVVSLMWIFNFVLPSIVGSYFVLNFNASFTEEKPITS